MIPLDQTKGKFAVGSQWTLHAKTADLKSLDGGMPQRGTGLVVDGSRYAVMYPPQDCRGMSRLTLEMS